jgi:transposase
MMGQRDRRQPELFVAGSLRDLVPEDHVLVRVDKVLDLSWLEAEVAGLYHAGIGRPGIAPEVAVRLMLAGMLLGIVHDRRLMREAQVNLAIRWFIGYGLHEPLPDHSSLTRIRQRWGAERFERIFRRTVQACVAARIATGEVVHLDSSLIRANVSWDAIARRHVAAVESANTEDGESGAPDGGTSRRRAALPSACTTDPDASLATNRKGRRSEPSYKHHTAVDAGCGVVLDVAVTTGAVHDTQTVGAQLDAISATTGAAIRTASMDASYAITRVFAELEARRIEAIIPTKAEHPPKRGVIPVRRFKLDAKNRVVRCPAKRLLRPHGKPDSDGFQAYRARVPVCQACRLRPKCFGATMKRRAILLHQDHPALLRARRKYARWQERERGVYRSHRIRVEGYHGEAKMWHGLGRAVRRGLDNMRIQAYLAAAAVNLKRLAAVLRLILACARQRSTGFQQKAA